MADRVRYDLEYLRNWSPWLDIKILFRSLAVIWSDYKSTY
jgi:putative colanic acid biosynthesis UDP-glucose lipid carrier transferase